MLENRHKSTKYFNLPRPHIKDMLFSPRNHTPNMNSSFMFCYLPELLQFVDLLGGDLACPELLLLRWNLHQPGQKAPVLDQRLPLGAVPVNVLQTALTGTWLPKHTNTHTHVNILFEISLCSTVLSPPIILTNKCFKRVTIVQIRLGI